RSLVSVCLRSQSQSVQVAAHDGLEVLGDLLGAPVPPGQFQQGADRLLVEAKADDPGGIAAHDAVSGDIGCYHGLACDDRTAADGDTRHDGGVVADPDVMLYGGVALVRQLAG